LYIYISFFIKKAKEIEEIHQLSHSGTGMLFSGTNEIPVVIIIMNIIFKRIQNKIINGM